MHPPRKPPVEWSRPLVFAWPASQPFYFILPSMIFVAAVLHVLALGLIRLVYPEPGENRLAPATVVVLPPDGGFWQHQSLWINAADPALFAANRVESTIQPYEGASAFSPSYLHGQLNWLAPEDPAGLPPTASPPVRPVSVRPLPDPTKATVNPPPPAPVGRLQVRGETVSEFPLPAALENKPLPPAPALFLVEVGPEGLPDYVFLEKSSGSGDWDEAAEAALRTSVLPASFVGAWLRLAVGPVPAPPTAPVDPSILP